MWYSKKQEKPPGWLEEYERWLSGLRTQSHEVVGSVRFELVEAEGHKVNGMTTDPYRTEPSGVGFG
ncbi:MAG: hypothetical protein A2Y91_00580 [Chloroflexi bacterium RBG_13_54_8]|nr:MAG: hypothetical protein A2Y91_00580 [Chloroflexi bacterium RBG_13_54_8]